jgi:hypothetical protein
MFTTEQKKNNNYNEKRKKMNYANPTLPEVIARDTLKSVKHTSNEIHSLRAQRRTHNESALLMHSAFVLSLVCVSLIGATATVKDFNYVAVIAGLSALGFISLGFGIVSSINARHNTRQMKIAQRKLAQLINS